MRREKLQRLQKFVFILLSVLLPTQLGLHFWPSWAYINGVRIDYFAPTIYLTDILVFTLVLLNFAAEPRVCLFGHFPALGTSHTCGEVRARSKRTLFYCFAGLLVLANIWFSLSPFVSAYYWLKAAEMGFLVWFVARGAFPVVFSRLPIFFLAPIFAESTLAIRQYLGQSSVGGIWYWFGERNFNLVTPGAARADIFGQLILRPYGTFPHPNVLAGFLAIGLLWGLDYFLHISRRIPLWGKLGIWGILGSGYAVLFLSLSRSAIFAGMAVTVWLIAASFRGRSRWVVVGAFALGVIGLALCFTTLSTAPESVAVREQLDKAALREWAQFPILGTGLGTAPLYGDIFGLKPEIRNYALAFQPAHNIYLLVLAEGGLAGVIVFGYLLWRAWQQGDSLARLLLAAVLFLGLFDHYFLTLQQGQLILALVLGRSFVSMKTQKIVRG